MVGTGVRQQRSGKWQARIKAGSAQKMFGCITAQRRLQIPMTTQLLHSLDGVFAADVKMNVEMFPQNRTCTCLMWCARPLFVETTFLTSPCCLVSRDVHVDRIHHEFCKNCE